MTTYQIDQDKAEIFKRIILEGDPKSLEDRKSAWITYLAAGGFIEPRLNEVDKEILWTVCVDREIVTPNHLLGNIIDTRVDMAAGRLLHRLDPELQHNPKAEKFIHEMFQDFQVR